MPDTGAPWNIPYVAGTDLVADWPTDSQTLAEAIADGLDAAGGIVAVKTVTKTDTQTASLTSGASTGITGLTIAHAVADAANRVVLIASVALNHSTSFRPGAAITAGGTQLDLGDAASSRTRVQFSGYGQSTYMVTLSSQAVHTPGSTSSITYGVDLINIATGTETLYVNRSVDDSDNAARPRGSSSLILFEVKV